MLNYFFVVEQRIKTQFKLKQKKYRPTFKKPNLKKNVMFHHQQLSQSRTKNQLELKTTISHTNPQWVGKGLKF